MLMTPYTDTTSAAAVHGLHTALQPPRLFTYPFCYEPHPLCIAAAREVQRHIAESGVWRGEQGGGKMFGVLVVEYGSGGSRRLGFVAAYSGLLAGRNDWSYFVPPVYDAQQPDGHFKRSEREISAINAEIQSAEQSYRLMTLRAAYAEAKADAERRTESMRLRVAAAKARRDARRLGGTPIDAAEQAAMIRESQYLKAEMRRLRAQCDAGLAARRKPIDDIERHIGELRRLRRAKSDELQQWLFAQYRMLNALGEERSLTDIFAQTAHAVPPAGAGDCCAPKLLQYAYRHALRPVCMAEFWWGESPSREIRHHLHYYPACRSKCLPILTHMLRGLSVEPNPLAQPKALAAPRIVYADDAIVVVDKPAGMLSVPGKEALPDVESYLKEHQELLEDSNAQPGAKSRQQLKTLKAVHRLDMDTSGLLVLARTGDAYRELQRQFASRLTRKRYEAILDGTPHTPARGTISLPLAPDMADRPRQCVDRQHGKAAVTLYSIAYSRDGRTLVSLEPHTGRTHQLRLHCAHAEGLACPILGDPLYGRGTPAGRMYLHAAELEIAHPVTGERMRFESPSGF